MEKIINCLSFNIKILNKNQERIIDKLNELEYKIEIIENCVLKNKMNITKNTNCINKNMIQIDVNMDKIDVNMDKIDVNMDKIDVNMDKIDVNMDKISENMDKIEQFNTDINNQFDIFDGDINNIMNDLNNQDEYLEVLKRNICVPEFPPSENS